MRETHLITLFAYELLISSVIISARSVQYCTDINGYLLAVSLGE